MNFQYLGESIYDSDQFKNGLLILYVICLFSFVVLKWTDHLNLAWKVLKLEKVKIQTYDQVLIIFSCLFIGMVFSRGYH